MKYIYKEIIKENNIVLRGVLNTPDDFDPDKKYPTVLYFHGFADDRNGIQFMNIQNSKYLTANGYIVFRFDFSGCGESDGSFYDINLTREIEEAELVHDFVEKESYVDKDNIFWKGHSMGGAVASIIAYKKNPKAMSLFAPAADFNEDNNPLMESISNAFKASYKEKIEGKDVGGLKVSEIFLKDAKSYDIYSYAKKYAGNVQIIRGDKDDIVTYDVDIKLKRSFPHAFYDEIKGTDHTFSDFDQRLEAFELMLDFLEKNKD